MKSTTTFEIYYPKSKKDWLSLRGLGGSDAAAILNLSNWKTPLDLYIEMTSDTQDKIYEEDEPNDVMKQGIAFEPLIRKAFALNHKEYKVINPPKTNWVFKSKERQYQTASLDGVLQDKRSKQYGVLEIKYHEVKNQADEQAYKSGLIPQQYYCQLLHYGLVTKFKFAYIVIRLAYFKYLEDGTRVYDHSEEIEKKIIYEEVKDDMAYLQKKEDEFIKQVETKTIPNIVLKV